MAPEQVRGEAADHRADIFAFGTILYEMVSGKRAFKRQTTVETMEAILNGEPPTLSHVVPTIPPGLARIIDRCLEKDPEQRFHSAHDLGFALEALSSVSEEGKQEFAPVRSRFPKVGISSMASIFVLYSLAVVTVFILVFWLRPVAMPKVIGSTQITRDGLPKLDLLTDGSRLYFIEVTAGHTVLSQVSTAGG